MSGAIKELFQNVSDGKTLIASAITDKGIATSNIDTFETMANNILNIPVMNTVQYGEKLYTFGALSDIHHNDGNNWNAKEDAQRAYSILKERGCEFIASAGDLIFNGTSSEFTEFKSTKDSYLGLPFYSCLGNHDGNNEVTWKNYTDCDFLYEVEKHGDIFLFIDVWNTYKDDVINWLSSKFVQHSNKRIFIFMHYPLPNTAGLKTGQYYGFSSTSTLASGIRELLNNNKNAIVFTGHTHYRFNVQNDYPNINIYNNNGNMAYTIHIPSLAYPRDTDGNELTEFSEGYVVEVYEKGVILKGIDFVENKFLDYAQYNLNVAPTQTDFGEIIVNKVEMTINENETDTFSVKLASAPVSNQTIIISKDNNNITIDKTELVFTPDNYNTEQIIAVTAVHNANSISNMSSLITLSSTGISSKTVSITNVNIDSIGDLTEVIGYVWENGGISSSTGADSSSGDIRCSYIEVNTASSYYISISESLSYVAAYAYTGDKTFIKRFGGNPTYISNISNNNDSGIVENYELTLPDNTAYIRIKFNNSTYDATVADGNKISLHYK